MIQVLEHLAELRGEEATLSEFPKEDLAKYLSPADLHVLEDPRESPSRFKTTGYLPRNLQSSCHSFHLNTNDILETRKGSLISRVKKARQRALRNAVRASTKSG